MLISDLEEVTERLRRENHPERLRATFVEAATHCMGIVESILARLLPSALALAPYERFGGAAGLTGETVDPQQYEDE